MHEEKNKNSIHILAWTNPPGRTIETVTVSVEESLHEKKIPVTSLKNRILQCCHIINLKRKQWKQTTIISRISWTNPNVNLNLHCSKKHKLQKNCECSLSRQEKNEAMETSNYNLQDHLQCKIVYTKEL